MSLRHTLRRIKNSKGSGLIGLRGNAKLVALLMTIVNRVKNVTKNHVLNLVVVGVQRQFAQKVDTVTLMTKFAFYLVNLIRIVLVAINALRVANV